MTLLTFGHGTAGPEAMVEVLGGAGVTRVVDVRRFPGSRRHPHVAREELERWLPDAGIGYRWEPRLGGRRSVPAESPDVWWQVAAFRAYAGYTRTEEFRAGLGALLADVADVAEAGRGQVAVMCSETVWWRCHRRLVSDVAMLLHDVPVLHLGHDGRLTTHPPSAGARRTDAGLVYDVVPAEEGHGGPQARS